MKNICEVIFNHHRQTMKEILDLEEFRLGQDKRAFKYFKRKIMDLIYSELQETFGEFEKEGLVKRCKCNSNLRHGYTDCPNCHGAGYVNVHEFD